MYTNKIHFNLIRNFLFCLFLFGTFVCNAQETPVHANESETCYLPDGTYKLEDDSNWNLTKIGNQFTETSDGKTTLSLSTTFPTERCAYFLQVIESTDPEIQPGFRYITQVITAERNRFEIKTLTATQGKYLTLLKVKLP